MADDVSQEKEEVVIEEAIEGAEEMLGSEEPEQPEKEEYIKEEKAELSEEEERAVLEKKARELKKEIEEEREKIGEAEAPEEPKKEEYTKEEIPEEEIEAPEEPKKEEYGKEDEAEPEVPAPPKGIGEFEEIVKKEKAPSAPSEIDKVKQRMEELNSKLQILKWDYDRGQINPARKVQYNKMLEEHNKLASNLKELQKGE